ncbi:MAG: hypothetical protein J0L62_15735 [Bacteroidetes bacterium]|nr:hypothetical protein [Bacteroidota bacterium]
MSTNPHTFPFGQPLKKVTQQDRSPKQVFVLGVYASAVHAVWEGPDGKPLVRALAVASEPEIFWTGTDAAEIIKGIKIPKEAGRLLPAASNLNGPSGKLLDSHFLKPLGFTRKDAWLCDLLPESRMNMGQAKAISAKYNPVAETFKLPKATIPPFTKSELKSKIRHLEILEELEVSHAKTLILLGDLPIAHFLIHFYPEFKTLSQFGKTSETYGKKHRLTINGKVYNVIPLCHPRQAGRLGASDEDWEFLHNNWRNSISRSFA